MRARVSLEDRVALISLRGPISLLLLFLCRARFLSLGLSVRSTFLCAKESMTQLIACWFVHYGTRNQRQSCTSHVCLSCALSHSLSLCVCASHSFSLMAFCRCCFRPFVPPSWLCAAAWTAWRLIGCLPSISPLAHLRALCSCSRRDSDTSQRQRRWKRALPVMQPRAANVLPQLCHRSSRSLRQRRMQISYSQQQWPCSLPISLPSPPPSKTIL